MSLAIPSPLVLCCPWSSAAPASIEAKPAFIEAKPQAGVIVMSAFVPLQTRRRRLSRLSGGALFDHRDFDGADYRLNSAAADRHSNRRRFGPELICDLIPDAVVRAAQVAGVWLHPFRGLDDRVTVATGSD